MGCVALVATAGIVFMTTRDGADDSCESRAARSASVRCAEPTNATVEAAEAGGRRANDVTTTTAKPSTTAEPSTTAAPTTTIPAPADPKAPAIIVLRGEDVPNPFVTTHDGGYLMFASNAISRPGNLPLRWSRDLITWEYRGDVMPQLPAWTEPGATWAPDVRKVGDDWVLWFTARLRGTSDPAMQCIGWATASRPEGPYLAAPEPSICQRERLGSIDPRTFLDVAGNLWIHWKSDDNADTDGDTTTSIYAQRLAPDGHTLVGQSNRILEVTQAWEGRIIEAPQMVYAPDGRLWLFYSGNWFNQPDYGLGVARCETPAGPCTKPFAGPWLSSNAQGEGPGEASLFTSRYGRLWIAYHPHAVDYRTFTPRPVALAPVAFDDAGPFLARP